MKRILKSIFLSTILFSIIFAIDPAIKTELDTTLLWLLNNPPNGENRAERNQHTDIIDHYSLQLSPTLWFNYKNKWGNDTQCDLMVNDHPYLYYLRQAELHAVNEIRNTVVTSGIIVWQLYNMGVVIKTPSKCFSIDISMRDAEDLNDVLDFALVTHNHADHYTYAFLNTMIGAGKTVITPFSFNGSTRVTANTRFQFGDIDLSVTLGTHGWEADGIPVALYQADCGPSGDNSVILHTGDCAKTAQFPTDKKVDYFIFHVSAGMHPVAAINSVKPQIGQPSHILEMGHAIGGSRYLYDYAFNIISAVPNDRSMILSYGEKFIPSFDRESPTIPIDISIK